MSGADAALPPGGASAPLPPGGADAPLWLIAACSVPGRVIGDRGRLPWHRPADLRHFKQVTLGHPVIMGRATWQSIGRPLPGRANLVCSRDPAFAAPGADVVADLDAAIARARAAGGTQPPVIIGGAQLYAQVLARGLATRAFITEIAIDVDGDARLAELGPGWRETARRADGDCTFLEFER